MPPDMACDELALRLHQGLSRQLAARGPVRTVETHISRLLLVGDDAYKFKKPLALGFLDFSSLAARRHFCEEELRLNRRTAPQIYLEVLPVLGPVDAPRLGRAGDAAHAQAALDWVLHMRRFDDRQVFDRLDEQAALSPARIDRLAQVLAGFHLRLQAEAAPAPEPHPGRTDRVGHWARDNLQALLSLPGGEPWHAALQALQRWTLDGFERLRPLMARRLAAGRVRECHGDLHLGNLVLIEDEPVLFDAIEFNPELRWIDVVADLSFPFMDLLSRGHEALAWRLVSAWFEHTGDHEGAALLAWAAAYRALVRAKVALIQAGQLGGEARHEALGKVRAGITLAQRLARRPAPRLVIVWGLSGTGKSTVAQQVVQALGALRLRSDVERKRLFGLQPSQRPAPAGQPGVGADQLYAPEATRRTYDRLEALASTVLAAGLSVVIDAACLRRAERDALRSLARTAGAEVLLLQCRAPVEALRQRLQARERRGDDASDAGVAVLERQLGFIEPPCAAEGPAVVALDTDVAPGLLPGRVREVLDAAFGPLEA
ncbi:hypothetical protein C7444_101390 [Sphaerotilus hippei]|uniref:Aminoglycoside phosphotransferase domain-containing protein n=1 Tax=Sphaerotilus hippei TaxID=744406 RepID=A0A318H6D7_9BURK|nr:bifunctional aminoglycoside phosphotransferase/ATP-binding protein [Sphaerotilus hippei]PXW99560.1 hypothetical protein C7444_101390 [Sphaerotilus hippei]